jgi:hypothetical protein
VSSHRFEQPTTDGPTQTNEGKKNKTLLFDARQAHAIGGQEEGNEGLHRFTEAISLLAFQTGGVRSGYRSSRRENEKCRQKCRPTRTANQPTHPTHQTNQPVKKQNSVGPKVVRSKESTKAGKLGKPFFSGPNSCNVRACSGFQLTEFY